MVNRKHESQKLTYRVDLPGGQQRLRELVLYVAERAKPMERFGLIKLNKILWKSDFTAFSSRGLPITGRAYQRLPLGPAPIEMQPLLAEMLQDQLIELEFLKFGKNAQGEDIIEKRPIALTEPALRWFSSDDLTFVDAAIDYYWQMTGTETSDDSHGIAWQSRQDLDPMPYESAYLSDSRLGPEQRRRAIERAQQFGWRSK